MQRVLHFPTVRKSSWPGSLALQIGLEPNLDQIRRFILVAFIAVSSVLMVVTLPQATEAMITPPLWTWVGLLCAATIAGTWILVGRRYRAIGFAYLGVLQLYLCVNFILSQSIHSIYYTVMPVCVIIAALSIGMKGAVWFSLISAGTTIACIGLNARYGLQLPYGQSLPAFTYSCFMNMLVMELVMLGIAMFHNSFRRRQQFFIMSERNKNSQVLYNYALGELVGSVSHEVNNPLAIISAISLKLARTPQETIDRDQLHGKLVLALQRIRYIVDGLKLFAEGELKEELRETNVLSICQFLKELNQESLKPLHIELCIRDLTENMLFPCRFQQLIRSLNGLIRNAQEAAVGLPGARIDVNVFRLDDCICFQVSDNGRGVPMSLREHLFEPFFSTKDLQVGQGLTLAVSRGLIEAQGGHLFYVPLPRGSSFSILLPLIPRVLGGQAGYAAMEGNGEVLFRPSLEIFN